MHPRPLAALAAVLALGAACAQAEVLRYSYRAGDQYRLVSTVRESVYIDGRFSHRAEILDRVAVSVTATHDDSGSHHATFEASERAWGASGSSYTWAEDYESQFERDAQGVFHIDPAYWMPISRDVPWFPDRSVAPGDTWVAPASESHDLRASFGVQEPFRFPVSVRYEYLRNEARDGIACAVIAIDYEIFYRVPKAPRTTNTYPARVTGTSSQTLWWDLAAGRELHSEEQFDIVFNLASGTEVEYVGESEGGLVEAKPLDRAAAAAEIQQELARQPMEGVTVAPDERGVTITIENVGFQPNSSLLLPAEQEKLRRIAAVLGRFPDRDILVTGHTAGVPGYTPAEHQQLSEQRARAVGDFLIKLGARRDDQLVIRGMGDRSPAGDNATEEGRRKNRRVEITILEN
jgi:outer membrane protein OmpA-like peptidoglycan-associated protein